MEINLFDVFCMGIDYGQLLMEQERENEELFDAFNCACVARKYCIPSTIIPRRQIHSKKWFDAKRQSYNKFIELVANVSNCNEFIFVTT
jgi:hypothetical protein